MGAGERGRGMRRRVVGRGRGSGEAGRVNVTPLIDVVMCLIVFYLIVGRLASDRSGRVDLPTSAVGEVGEAGEGLILNVMPRGGEVGAPVVVVVEGREVPAGELEGVLRERGGGGVQVRADRSLAFGEVRGVVDTCRRAGLRSIRLAAERARVSP